MKVPGEIVSHQQRKDDVSLRKSTVRVRKDSRYHGILTSPVSFIVKLPIDQAPQFLKICLCIIQRFFKGANLFKLVRAPVALVGKSECAK